MSSNDDDVVLEPEADDGESGVGTAEQKMKQLRDKLRHAEAEAGENLAGWQRTKADYVNLSKRMRELEGAMGKAGIAALATEIIAVFDSIEAAGMEAILKQLDGALARHGVVRFTPNVGDAFDPTREEAVSTVATNIETEDNTIHQVLQSGYVMDEITLRPARVIVKNLT